MAPRGIRLNNPGNIEFGDNWNGLSKDQPDARFCKFDDPKYGIRAMCKIFFSYMRRDADGVLTVAEIVTQWAPPNENPTEAYIRNVCKWSGFEPDAYVDTTSVDDLVRVCMAMARQENGTHGFNEDIYRQGAELAVGG